MVGQLTPLPVLMAQLLRKKTKLAAPLTNPYQYKALESPINWVSAFVAYIDNVPVVRLGVRSSVFKPISMAIESLVERFKPENPFNR